MTSLSVLAWGHLEAAFTDFSVFGSLLGTWQGVFCPLPGPEEKLNKTCSNFCLNTQWGKSWKNMSQDVSPQFPQRLVCEELSPGGLLGLPELHLPLPVLAGWPRPVGRSPRVEMAV